MDIDFNKIINEALSNEAKKIILENEGPTIVIHHIHCDGEPVDSFNNEEDAIKHLDIYKSTHPDKEFTIEKGDYNSYPDMLDKLDDMGEAKELNETKEMKKETRKVKTLGQAVLDAKESGLNEFKLNGETYNVGETWKQLEEEELSGGQKELDKNDNGKIDADDFTILRGEKNEGEGETCPSCGSPVEDCECEGHDHSDEMMEGAGTCNECGSELNEEGMCNECSTSMMNENKKKTLRLTESELVELISKMVNESVPGLEVTKKAQSGSKKDNDEYLNDVEKKMKDYASFDGNDNPEFPNQEGMGEDKEARQNTEEEDDFVADNRGGGLEDLNYDNEPSEMFKERLRMALSGDEKMGNSQEYANVIKSDLGKKIAKKVERRRKSIEDAPMYNKDVQPVKMMNESLEKELSKIKNLAEYNKRTQ